MSLPIQWGAGWRSRLLPSTTLWDWEQTMASNSLVNEKWSE